MWPPVRLAYRYVRRVARLLKNEAGRPGQAVRRGLRRLLAEMRREAGSPQGLSGAVGHFVKVSASYEPGLFHCYEVADLPRTNNDLEQFFGSHRYHERRASGRKGASPGLVLRGQVRLLAAAATRRHRYRAEELAGADPGQREELRRQLEARRRRRVSRSRFRRDPKAFLCQLEEQLLQSALPS